MGDAGTAKGGGPSPDLFIIEAVTRAMLAEMPRKRRARFIAALNGIVDEYEADSRVIRLRAGFSEQQIGAARRAAASHLRPVVEMMARRMTEEVAE